LSCGSGFGGSALDGLKGRGHLSISEIWSVIEIAPDSEAEPALPQAIGRAVNSCIDEQSALNVPNKGGEHRCVAL